MLDREREISEFYSRLDDIARRADSGELGISQFLTEAEAARADRYLKRCGASFALFGGYADAERKRLYILPDYVEYAEGDEIERVLCDYGFSAQIKALLATGSGYATLTHRDFLGSLLALGLERSVIGDILLLDGGERAVIFCDERISGFICEELSKVARDKVRVSEIELGSVTLPERRFADISHPVSSMRLDCVVSALCNLSRERVSEMIEAGLVTLDFEIEPKPDRKVSPQSVISVRGFGKYRLICADGLTKKGKIRLQAQKYL